MIEKWMPVPSKPGIVASNLGRIKGKAMTPEQTRREAAFWQQLTPAQKELMDTLVDHNPAPAEPQKDAKQCVLDIMATLGERVSYPALTNLAGMADGPIMDGLTCDDERLR